MGSEDEDSLGRDLLDNLDDESSIRYKDSNY